MSKTKEQPAKESRTPWDAAFKAFFSHLVMVESVIRSFLQPGLVAQFDFSTLEPCPTNHLNKTMRQRFNDAIWRVKIGDTWLYCYIMFEFQRKTDKLMAFRIAEYNSLLVRSLYKARQVSLDADVPPIIPVVIFMGEGSWTAPLDTVSCWPDLSAEMRDLQLRQKYILVEANRKTAGSQTSLAEILFAICDSDPGQVSSLVDKLETMLRGEECENLRQLFMEMINCAILRPAGIEAIDPSTSFQEAREMFARARRWREETYKEAYAVGEENGFKRGDEQGVNKGRAMERNDIALEMLRAGEPRARIIQFTKLTEAELDKLQ